MEIGYQYSFQVDSEIVKSIYQNQENYKIEYSADNPKEYCIVYFSSNNIYFPNIDQVLHKEIIIKNRFEWYKTRIHYGYKHIFIRDIQKQWYLGGINSNINTPQKLLSFLKEETKGFRIIMIGSSAGGFASVLFGQLLNAEKIYSFNGQFEISSLLDTSCEALDPLIFRNKDNVNLRNWYDTRNFISNPSSIYYFQSINSKWDIKQYDHIRDLKINQIPFKTSNHGVPFLSANLPDVINFSTLRLDQLTKKINNPLIFSIRTIGIIRTVVALTVIVKFGLKKIYIYTILKK